MTEQLALLAGDARQFLLPHWNAWHKADGAVPAVVSTGTCGRSSLFLVHILHHYNISAAWVTGQMLSKVSSTWESHSWVQAGTSIVDITADQFGAMRLFWCHQQVTRVIN